MQTFLPYADFAKSANVLDRKRLGKQRVECLQITRTLYDVSKGWQNHPAVRMWRGSEIALASYAEAICDEWTSRGYTDNCMGQIAAITGWPSKLPGGVVYPPWLGDEAFHASHRSNLLRKDISWYGKLGWVEPVSLPYVWPVS